jgi:hypothetical protein
MATRRAETEAFLDAVEKSAHRTLRFRDDIGALIDLCDSQNMRPIFDDVLFLAKFVSNARNVISRVGPGSEETNKLASELKEQMEKIATLLRIIVKDAPGDLKVDFTENFLLLGHESLANLFALLAELSWIKNYDLDRGGSGPRPPHP